MSFVHSCSCAYSCSQPTSFALSARCAYILSSSRWPAKALAFLQRRFGASRPILGSGHKSRILSQNDKRKNTGTCLSLHKEYYRRTTILNRVQQCSRAAAPLRHARLCKEDRHAVVSISAKTVMQFWIAQCEPQLTFWRPRLDDATWSSPTAIAARSSAQTLAVCQTAIEEEGRVAAARAVIHEGHMRPHTRCDSHMREGGRTGSVAGHTRPIVRHRVATAVEVHGLPWCTIMTDELAHTIVCMMATFCAAQGYSRFCSMQSFARKRMHYDAHTQAACCDVPPSLPTAAVQM